MMTRLSRCLPITLVSRNAGIAVQTNAIIVSVSGCVRAVWLSPRLPCGKVAYEFGNALAEINRQAEDRAQLDDDGKHLPVAIAKIDVQQRLGKYAGAPSS